MITTGKLFYVKIINILSQLYYEQNIGHGHMLMVHRLIPILLITELPLQY